jgi:hypothetical protein
MNGDSMENGMSGVHPVFNLNEKTGAGFGGSEWLWVVVLFVLLGGGGNLFGNKGNTATQADLVQRLRPAPVPAFIVPAPTGTTTPTP